MKRIEQDTVKDEKCLFLGLEIRKSPQGVRMEECVFNIRFLAAVQPQDVCERKSVRAQLSGDATLVASKTSVPPLLSLKL